MCKRTPSEPVGAAAWRRFQNCRPASCSASSNSVAIGPPSESPETAAFVNEAAIWLVRDERLLDVAGDDRIQSKVAARWSMAPTGPGVPRCIDRGSDGLTAGFHMRSTAHEAPDNRVGCTAHLRPPQRRETRGIAMSEVRRRGEHPATVCRSLGVGRSSRCPRPSPLLLGETSGGLRRVGPAGAGRAIEMSTAAWAGVAMRSPGRTVH
jgi:hypothetical protein